MSTRRSIYHALKLRNRNIDKWLIHMFQQKKLERLMLVLGGGISMDVGVPSWKQLVSSISETIAKKYAKDSIYQSGEPIFDSQILKNRVYHQHTGSSSLPIKRLQVSQEWHQIVYDALYSATPTDISEILRIHPYLEQLSSIALDSPYTLTFNFDDLLWEGMMHVATGRKRANPSDNSRQPNVIWKPQISEHPTASTIFHINGRLPHRPLAKRSEELIFTEDSFADAFLSVNTPIFEQHFYKISNSTPLIVGHSLQDNSLKNLLRSLRSRVPGNISYQLRHYSDDAQLTPSERKDIFDANLEVYNIITVFIKTEEINLVLDILNKSEDEFITELTSLGCKNTAQRYYVVGPVGAGKTTTLEHLRHFWTLEEWPAEILGVMYKRSDSEEAIQQQDDIATVVDRNIALKNTTLAKQHVGYHFVDRGPFDALAFLRDPSERPERRRELAAISGGRLEPGEICFISAGGEECERRNWRRGRPPSVGGDQSYFDEQERDLLAAYGLDGRKVYDSQTYSPGQIARMITLKALLGEYEPWVAVGN